MKGHYTICFLILAFLLKFNATAQNCATVYGIGNNWVTGSTPGIQSYNYTSNTWNGTSQESLSYFTAPNTINTGANPIAIDPLNQYINVVTDATNPYNVALFTFGNAPTFISFPASLSSITRPILCSGYKPNSHVCYYMSQYFLSTSPSPANTGFFSIDFTNPASPAGKNYSSVLAPGSPSVNTSSGGDICFDANGTGYLVTSGNQLYTIVIDETAITATFTLIANLSAISFKPTAIAFDPINPGSLTITGLTTDYVNYNLATNVTTELTSNSGWSSDDLASCVFPNLNPNLNITKSIYDVTQASAPPFLVATNDIIKYTITVKNTGNVNSGNFILTDTLPSGVTYVANSTTMNGSAVADGTGNTFPFASGSSANSNDQAVGSGILSTNSSLSSPECIITYEVKVTAGNGFTVTNTAVASVTGSSPSIPLADTAYAPFTVDMVFLPLSLVNFSADQSGNTAKLNWTTGNETNLSRFQIERSAFGESFIAIDSIKAGVENSSAGSSYMYTDARPLAGNNYYRLKMINTDGTYSYSSVQLVDFIDPIYANIRLYPNPVAKEQDVTLSLGNGCSLLTVSFLNMTAQVVTSQNFSSVNNSVILNTSSLTKGVYYVLIVADGKALQPLKLIIE